MEKATSNIHYAGLLTNDFVNGEGVCVSVWMQGCPHKCENCHNPQTWNFDAGEIIQLESLTENVIRAINANGIQRNLSFLGGEPLTKANLPYVSYIIKEVKKIYPNIKIFIWTGYDFEVLLEKPDLEGDIYFILCNTNVLIDGKFEKAKRDVTLKWRGSSNQRVIDVPASLSAKKVILYEDNI